MNVEINYKHNGKQEKKTADSFQKLYYELGKSFHPYNPTLEEDNFIENMNFFNISLYKKLMRKDLHKAIAYWESFRERIKKEEDYKDFIQNLLAIENVL